MCKENYGGIYDPDLDVNADGKVSEEEFFMGLDGMTLNRNPPRASDFSFSGGGWSGVIRDAGGEDEPMDEERAALVEAGIDPEELELMDDEERAETLDELGLDPDDF